MLLPASWKAKTGCGGYQLLQHRVDVPGHTSHIIKTSPNPLLSYYKKKNIHSKQLHFFEDMGKHRFF
jgi:hypothetical protein